MPNEKQFDFATIAVIIVSIVLILGGFYLLNQSFTKKQDPNKVAILNVSSVSSSTPSSSSISSSSSSSSTTPSSSEKSSISIESSSSKSSSSVISSSSVESSSASSESKPSTMSESEALVKVLESAGSSYKIEVIDTGFKDGKFWKVGKQMKINSTIPLKVDQEYKLSGIQETANNTTIGLIQEKK
jgi:hypothetical protein